MLQGFHRALFSCLWSFLSTKIGPFMQGSKISDREFWNFRSRCSLAIYLLPEEAIVLFSFHVEFKDEKFLNCRAGFRFKILPENTWSHAEDGWRVILNIKILICLTMVKE